MHDLPTVVLEHVNRHGTHFDWMLADPAHRGESAERRLITFSTSRHPAHWPDIGRLILTPLPPHRGAYLNYEGPVSNQRGRVRRVACGSFRPVLWTRSRRVIDVDVAHYAARWGLDRISDRAWRAVVLAAPRQRGMLRAT